MLADAALPVTLTGPPSGPPPPGTVPDARVTATQQGGLSRRLTGIR